MNTARQFVLILGVIVVAGCDAAPTPLAPSPGQPTFAAATDPASGHIAFVSNRDGNSEIYVMNADGTGLTRLTNDPGSDVSPAWSPDGSRIAFASDRSGNTDIYVMNADGTGVTRLTTTPTSAWSAQPAWCGHRIAFASDQYLAPFTDVYVMNDDGTGVTRLTIDNATSDEFPTWSPDCSRIAFSLDPDASDAAIGIMNADGTRAGGLITGPGRNRYPAWSPDGTRLAFTSNRDDGFSWEVYVVEFGGQATRLTVGGKDYHSYYPPAWSPDGAQIAVQFHTQQSGALSDAMYVMNADGSGVTLLADSTPFTNRPAWTGVSAPPPPNQPPVAAFTSSCGALSCALTSSSSDPDGTISTYTWDFGDGQTSAAQNPSHTYAAPGTYTVTLTVTDNGGATNSVAHAMTVTPPNQPPVAAFTSSCSALTCAFTSTSSDVDGSISAYSWTFGDGATSTVQNPSHTYAANGTYSVTLGVTDNQGATGSVSQTVRVHGHHNGAAGRP